MEFALNENFPVPNEYDRVEGINAKDENLPNMEYFSDSRYFVTVSFTTWKKLEVV